MSVDNASGAGGYFNNFLTRMPLISANKNDSIVAYFEQYTNGNKSAANALSSSIIYTAQQQGLDPMQILAQIAALPHGHVDKYIAMFLNLNRVGTSFLGVNGQPIVNKYIQRSIIS